MKTRPTSRTGRTAAAGAIAAAALVGGGVAAAAPRTKPSQPPAGESVLAETPAPAATSDSLEDLGVGGEGEQDADESGSPVGPEAGLAVELTNTEIDDASRALMKKDGVRIISEKTEPPSAEALRTPSQSLAAPASLAKADQTAPPATRTGASNPNSGTAAAGGDATTDNERNDVRVQVSDEEVDRETAERSASSATSDSLEDLGVGGEGEQDADESGSPAGPEAGLGVELTNTEIDEASRASMEADGIKITVSDVEPGNGENPG